QSTNSDKYLADGGWGIAVDTASPANVYTTGIFTGTWDFDPTAGTYLLASNGLRDVFVSKLTQSTSPALQAPGSGTSLADATPADRSAALTLVTGSAADTTSFFPGDGSGKHPNPPLAETDSLKGTLVGVNPSAQGRVLVPSLSAMDVDQLLADFEDN